MIKSLPIHDKDIVRKIFAEKYKYYIEQYAKVGIELKYKITHMQKNKIFVSVMLVPASKKTKYYGKSFFAVIKKAKNASNTHEFYMERNFILEIFFKHYLKMSKQKSPEDICSETIPNLILRILFSCNHKRIPKKFKGKDIQWIYSLIYLLIFAFSCFLVAYSRIELSQTMGWDW